jgi:DNA-binding transcriptional MocR family regulator
MASPITSTLATHWIRDGVADLALANIRKESMARQKIAARILPEHSYASEAEAFHLWIKLRGGWQASSFSAQMRSNGVAVVGVDAFSVTPPRCRPCGCASAASPAAVTSSMPWASSAAPWPTSR